MDNDPNHTAQATQDHFKARKVDFMLLWHVTQAAFHLLKVKLTASDGGYSEGLSEQQRE